ncbi:GspE/PulE/PilB domain-containing protein [Rubinisphaera margarita]|uniref:GspE/PulE/PilB domain-containing protein n=1 Tax=Rubinisphaera margarita TaxID=2909586 RepID=UPI001EE980F0|nr:general secretion pathway protein GspE [Rubinisphaera margarita]MCG6154765.1 general secretion pathway protein GspE [Rubinisphaera margarita]
MAIDVYKQWLGIPEEFRPPNHYQLLRLVDFEDDPEKIRGHYKKLNALVRQYATGDYMIESQDLLNELAKAMLCLTDTHRKREYDESLGREFAEPETSGGQPLLRYLAVNGEISKGQISEIKEFADRRGLTHRDAVVQMKLATPDKAAEALAQELGRPFVDLESTLPDDNVLDQVPRKLVKRYSILPLFVDDDVVLIAATDEPDHELEDEFRLRFGKPMRAVIATPLQINQAIAKYYAPGARDEAVAIQNVSGGGKKSKSRSTKTGTAKPVEDMSDAEKREKKMLGYIILCWATIGAAVVDQFVIKEYLLPRWSFFVGLVLIVPPVTFFLIKDSHLKLK